jgi:biopolymer transport protein ExbD
MPLKTMRDEQSSINLAPMIDIIFLLIIFFMVSSRFTERADQERDLAVRVPQVAPVPSSTAIPTKRTVNVLAGGGIQLDGQLVQLAELERQLRSAVAQVPQTAVVVRGDSNSAYQAVADVIAVCRRVNVQDINLAVRVAQQEQ